MPSGSGVAQMDVVQVLLLVVPVCCNQQEACPVAAQQSRKQAAANRESNDHDPDDDDDDDDDDDTSAKHTNVYHASDGRHWRITTAGRHSFAGAQARPRTHVHAPRKQASERCGARPMQCGVASRTVRSRSRTLEILQLGEALGRAAERQASGGGNLRTAACVQAGDRRAIEECDDVARRNKLRSDRDGTEDDSDFQGAPVSIPLPTATRAQCMHARTHLRVCLLGVVAHGAVPIELLRERS